MVDERKTGSSLARVFAIAITRISELLYNDTTTLVSELLALWLRTM
jgi:hypothetical protein